MSQAIAFKAGITWFTDVVEEGPLYRWATHRLDCPSFKWFTSREVTPNVYVKRWCIWAEERVSKALSWRMATNSVLNYEIIRIWSGFLLVSCQKWYLNTYGCGSKCKVWIKPRSHKRSRPLIQTPDPDLSKGGDPDLWSRPLEWYYLWASWCLQLFTLPSSQATNCFKATLPSCQASKLHLLQSHAAKLSSSPAARVVQPRFQAFKLQLFSSNQAV